MHFFLFQIKRLPTHASLLAYFGEPLGSRSSALDVMLTLYQQETFRSTCCVISSLTSHCSVSSFYSPDVSNNRIYAGDGPSISCWELSGHCNRNQIYRQRSVGVQLDIPLTVGEIRLCMKCASSRAIGSRVGLHRYRRDHRIRMSRQYYSQSGSIRTDVEQDNYWAVTYPVRYTRFYRINASSRSKHRFSVCFENQQAACLKLEQYISFGNSCWIRIVIEGDLLW